MNDIDVSTGAEVSGRTLRDYALIALTLALGWSALILIMVFISMGAFNLVNLELGEGSILLLNMCLSLGFFVQHSGMIRGSFRRWSSRVMDERYQGVLYTISSSLMLLLIVALWQQSNFTIASAQGGLRWVLRGLFYLLLLGFVWGLGSLGRIDAFGLDPIRNSARRAATAPDRLMVRGPYRWVRHPLYLFCILMIWSCPDLTADRLFFNVLWTAWIILATFLEERDLVALFGEDYRSYQSLVPMILPTSIRPVFGVQAVETSVPR